MTYTTLELAVISLQLLKEPNCFLQNPLCNNTRCLIICIGGFCLIMQEQSNLAALLTLCATYIFMADFMTSIGSCQELARNKFAYKNLRNAT